MGWTREVLRTEIAKYLFEMGNIEFQKNAWSGKERGFAGNKIEAIESFLGCGIPEYLIEFQKSGFITKDESSALEELSMELVKFDFFSKENNHSKLLKNTNWISTTRLAYEIFQKFFEPDLRKYCVNNNRSLNQYL